MKQQNHPQVSPPRKPLTEFIHKKKFNSADGTEPIFNGVIQKYFIKSCEVLEMELPIWRQYHRQYENAPEPILMMYFKYIEQFGFNPLAQEIIITESPEHSWQIMITVDGWAKYLNRHPQFVGITFEESAEQINHIPKWIECSIFRKDRSSPITIREYYLEVKTEHSTWIQMPRRMLRHRALSQCARLAFGIGNPECHDAGNIGGKHGGILANQNRLADHQQQDLDNGCETENESKGGLATQSRIELLRARLL